MNISRRWFVDTVVYLGGNKAPSGTICTCVHVKGYAKFRAFIQCALRVQDDIPDFHLSGFINKHNYPIWDTQNPITIVEEHLCPHRVLRLTKVKMCAVLPNDASCLFVLNLEND